MWVSKDSRVCGCRKLVVCCVKGFCVCMSKVCKMSVGVKGL